MLTYKKYNYILVGLFSICIVSISVYVIIKDPYWIYTEKPSWLIENNDDRLIDRKLRFIKQLQLIIQQPKIIVIGSSKVYRGIPTNLYYDFYNLGLSSLMLTELDTYIRYAVKYTNVKTIIIGLDFFAFAPNLPQQNPGYDPNIYYLKNVIKNFFTSVLSKSVLNDIQGLFHRNNERVDGIWTKTGDKKTTPISAKTVYALYNARLATHMNNPNKKTTEKQYELFNNLLLFLQNKKIKVIIYISPYNDKMIQIFKQAKEYNLFLKWGREINEIAGKNNIEVHDFSENNPFYFDNMLNGSTEYWIDETHYTQKVGKWIINKLQLSSIIKVDK
jgi:hypothetical protein